MNDTNLELSVFWPSDTETNWGFFWIHITILKNEANVGYLLLQWRYVK